MDNTTKLVQVKKTALVMVLAIAVLGTLTKQVVVGQVASGTLLMNSAMVLGMIHRFVMVVVLEITLIATEIILVATELLRLVHLWV